MSHLSYEGQNKTDYCLECLEKHGEKATVLQHEAVQRGEANGCDSDGVQEKMKGVAKQLLGIEDDSTTVTNNERIDAINGKARALWKEIYASGAEIGKANIEQLKHFQDELEKLTDMILDVRKTEGDCPTCQINTDEAIEEAEEEEEEVEEEVKVKVEAPKSKLDEYGRKASEARQKLFEEIHNARTMRER